MTKSFFLAYETFGNVNHPCIILIMGIGGQLIDWPAAFTQGLVDHGFYVVTFDNRDSGLSKYYDELATPSLNEATSAKQQGQTFHPPYTIKEMASDTIALMNELHIKKAHIAGISMGGIIAEHVGMHFSERVHSLILMETTSGDPNLPPTKKEVLDFFENVMNTNTQSLDDYIKKTLALAKIYYHPASYDEKILKNHLILSYQRANRPDGFKRLILALLCEEPRMQELKKLMMPCLIIHGDCDPVFSTEHGKQLAELIPNSQLAIIENMGHGFPDHFSKTMVDLIVNFIEVIN